MERPVPEWSGLPCEWIHSSACPSSGAIFRTVDPHVVASVEATAGSFTSFGASLRITLNPIETAGVYTFNVVLTNDRSAATTVSPLSSWGLAITSGGQSASSTTKPTGEVDFTIQKTESTIPGGGNRTVTYSFSGRITSNPVYPSESWVGRWSTKDLTFIDVIPAGATVTFSTGAGGAAWTHVDNLDGSQTWSLVIPGPFAGEVQVEPGATVWWRSVANTGNVDLTDVTIDDARLGDPVVIGDLAAGSSSSIVLARPGLAEGYANVATVTGEWSDCTVEDTDDAQVRVDEAADEPTGAPSRVERPAHVWLHPS